MRLSPRIERTISRNPDFFYARLWLAAAYAQLGRMEEAKAEGAKRCGGTPAFLFSVSRNVRRSGTPPCSHAWSMLCARRACWSEARGGV